MLKKVTRRLLLLGIFSLLMVKGFEIPNGCFVTDSFQESVSFFDTLDFFMTRAFDPETSTELLLTCDLNNHDRLLLSSFIIILERVRSERDFDGRKFANPEELKHWKEFHLGFVGSLTLKDDENRSWLPQNLTMDCIVKKIEISNGMFTRHCPQGTLTWKMENNSEKKISLLKTKHRQRLTLVSSESFSPILSISGTDVKLGMSDGRIKTGETARPLSPGQHIVYIESSHNNGSSCMKVLNEEENVIFIAPLTQVSNSIGVKRAGGGKFIVVQHTKEYSNTTETGEEFSTNTDNCVMNIDSSILVLGLIVVILLVQICDIFIVIKTTDYPVTPRKGNSNKTLTCNRDFEFPPQEAVYFSARLPPQQHPYQQGPPIGGFIRTKK